MICYKDSRYYNPLKVAPDGKPFEARYINAFYVFDKTGVILKHERGWFSEYNGFELEGLACVKKVKIDFNCKTAFLKPVYDYGEKKYDVYIPASALGLQKPIYTKQKDFVVKTIKTKNDGIWFDEYKSLDTQLWDIYGKIENCVNELTHYNLTCNLEKFDENLKQLKKLRKKWDDALEYKNNYTIEMAIAEGF